MTLFYRERKSKRSEAARGREEARGMWERGGDGRRENVTYSRGIVA